ncbi:sensor histidine kinase [Streptomyces paludis]|uniref:Sensor histidine kinase n=2 Tax=Streptomyces paludis TaxID=2282738 RepID=A0A345I143_9ACTN|nr:sensor histidine kinase [Streptomyces paludis]
MNVGTLLPFGAGPVKPALFLMIVVHAWLCVQLSSRALDWRLGQAERPVRLLLAVAGYSAAALATLLALRGTAVRDEDFGVLLLAVSGFGLGAVAMGLRTARHGVRAVLGTVGGTVVVALLAGKGWAVALLCAAGVTAMGSLFTCAYLLSAWMVSVVWELDAAREAQTRLAVAEERLRFGRDMHDVMGRNLAVIALKSELAVQLAERGRPEAIAQMTEVQRIARESQREVRDVVRGYREANLHTELDGARSVLAAAGIDCRIEEAATGAALPAEVQSALGWVVREATTNVLRHGDARRCTVRLSVRERGSEALLTVENDGVPDPAADAAAGEPTRPGTGLAGLRERLVALDGTLEAGAVAGGCFRLTVRVPLPKAGAAAGAGTGAGAGAGAVTSPVPGVVSPSAPLPSPSPSVSALDDEMAL